jgi:uncharacterized protein (TIGR02271 family)
MALHKIQDFDADYRQHFEDSDIKGQDLYSGHEKVGSVEDILVDDDGRFRYLVVSTGIWILGKKILFPIGLARIDQGQKRVYADGLTKPQVESLPEFRDDMVVDYDHEEQLRSIYRPTAPRVTQSEPSSYGVSDAGMGSIASSSDIPSANLDEPTAYDRATYSYDKDPSLYALNDQNHPNLKLYEERLVADKTRQKAGETVIGKRVETETAQASIGIEKERVVIERVATSNDAAVPASEANFQPGEVQRVEIYEEVPEFRKEAFVREEIKVSKVVDQETATAEEDLRREELEVDGEVRSSSEGRH